MSLHWNDMPTAREMNHAHQLVREVEEKMAGRELEHWHSTRLPDSLPDGMTVYQGGDYSQRDRFLTYTRSIQHLALGGVKVTFEDTHPRHGDERVYVQGLRLGSVDGYSLDSTTYLLRPSAEASRATRFVSLVPMRWGQHVDPAIPVWHHTQEFDTEDYRQLTAHLTYVRDDVELLIPPVPLWRRVLRLAPGS